MSVDFTGKLARKLLENSKQDKARSAKQREKDLAIFFGGPEEDIYNRKVGTHPNSDWYSMHANEIEAPIVQRTE